MHLKIRHRTEYRYETPVRYSIQELRLIPSTNAGQEVSKWKINTPIKASNSIDTFGNACSVFVQESPYTSMMIEAEGEIRTQDAYEFIDNSKAVSPYYLLQQTNLTEPSEEMLAYFASKLPKKNFFAEESPNLASHAWIDFCSDIDKGIWTSIDITHACLVDARHIRLAIGKDYYSAAPVKGVRTGGGGEELSATISIQKLA